MDFSTLPSLSGEALTEALSLDFAALDNDALTAALTERKAHATTMFALTAPTIAEVDVAEALVASIGAIESEQATRATAAQEAADRFAAARATFSAEGTEGTEDADEADEDADEADEDEADEDADEDSEDADDSADEAEATVTASGVNHTRTQRVTASAAKKVAKRVKRPAVQDTSMVTITASADVPGFQMNAPLTGMDQVAAAVQARVGGFSPFNQRAAEAAHSQSGGQPVLNKFGVASFSVGFDKETTATKGNDYSAVQASVKSHKERQAALVSGNDKAALTAAGWCAPSEVIYNWISDYVVDGLLTLPEISAPRGGVMITTGPALAQTTYADLDDFGFGGTEAEAIAGYVKTCETIECPEFVDHRLDFSGYCWKIPILTESAYPELVADALRLSDVLYAHKMNKRFIGDIVGLSTSVDATPFGGTFTDTIEALTQVAVKERRWWNVGENAVMEVKLPQVSLDIFKFDMARRSGLALTDVATTQKVAAHFANHNLAVEYVSDWQENIGEDPVTAEWPAVIDAIMYPSGTFARAVKPVINLSAVYDAASLSANEYTGVFFEQGVKTVQLGYRSHVLTIPVCTAGVTGANAFECTPLGSF